MEIPLSYFRKEEIKRLIKEYDASLNTQQDFEDRHIRDNLIEEVHEETSFEDIFENHHHVISTENNEDVEKLEEPFEQHIPSDPIEDIYEGPLIEDVIEYSLHNTIIETIEDLKDPRDYFSKDDHMCILDLP